MTRRSLVLSILVAMVAIPLLVVAQQKAPAVTAKPVVVIETSLGVIKAELYPDKAPVSVKNFLEYVDAKFYDGTIFHRVVPNFVVQGGGFLPSMDQKKTRAPIVNEAANGLKNSLGTLAMARTSIPDSATSQFYINLKDNSSLDYRGPSSSEIGYCVFGKVIEGMAVVDKIKKVPTGEVNGMGNVPIDPVVIRSVKRAN